MRHDENKDVRLVSRKANVNIGTKTITISHNDIIGIRTWARIDFLVHYCKYHLNYGEILKSVKNTEDYSENKKEIKKEMKHKMIRDGKTTKLRNQNKA